MIAKSWMSPEEQALKYSRDLKNVIDTAYADGYKEGLEMLREDGKIEGKVETARVMKNNNENIDKIILYTGLTKKDIESL